MIGYDEKSNGSLVRQKLLLLTKRGGVGHSIWVGECHRRLKTLEQHELGCIIFVFVFVFSYLFFNCFIISYLIV